MYIGDLFMIDLRYWTTDALKEMLDPLFLGLYIFLYMIRKFLKHSVTTMLCYQNDIVYLALSCGVDHLDLKKWNFSNFKRMQQKKRKISCHVKVTVQRITKWPIAISHLVGSHIEKKYLITSHKLDDNIYFIFWC